MTDYAPIAALMACDAYKLDHRRQYLLAGDVTCVYSNYTNRRSRMPGVDKVVHFGLQAYLQQHLMDAYKPFFAASEDEVCSLYHKRLEKMLGAAAAEGIGTDHIRALHKLGYLPLRFCGLPEGTLVPIRVPSFTVQSTLGGFGWLTNYIETGLSAAYWQPSTSATIAHEYRKILVAAAQRTGADMSDVDYQLHDFSMRGMSSHETAAASGAGHLLSFKGTDSCVSLDWIDRYYGEPYDAKSVPATEHSVMSAGTATRGEFETYSRLLDLYPTGTVAIVSDTFDLWCAITSHMAQLKDKIMSRTGGAVVCRPDSGDPFKILLGDNDAPYGSPVYYGVVRLLANIFGTRLNSYRYHELDPHIGVIYGDSITLDRAQAITQQLMRIGFASTTVTLGVGSYTYNYVTRDTFGSAMKATWAEINGKGVNLFKDPVTDDGTKRSATGRLAVLQDANTGELRLLEAVTLGGLMETTYNCLEPVWEDGKFLRRQTFEDVRRTLAGSQYSTV